MNKNDIRQNERRSEMTSDRARRRREKREKNNKLETRSLARMSD